MDNWTLPLADLYGRVNSSPQGLSTAEAQRRLAAQGPNDPAPRPTQNVLAQILSYFANPLVVVLLLAAVISGALGELVDAGIIIVMVLLSVALNFTQTYRSQRAAERLHLQVAPAALVLRDGQWTSIPRRALVPGDIIRIAAGDLVPADARLIEAHDLHAHQAALTGESLPVEKQAGDFGAPAGNPGEARNAVFLGTSVVSGTATALVFATGRATAFGDIALRLAARPPETEFERGTRQFGLLIMRTVMFLVLFVFLVSALLHRNLLESFLFAVALAVGLTPEFLPMITTVTLGQGAVHMARQKVIVKHLESIQNFGSIDVFCSDKTGTLTTGDMVLDRRLDPLGNPDERPYLLAYLNSYFETGIKNPLDAAILGRADANPLDLAILAHDQPTVESYQKLDEVPFDYERRRISIIVQVAQARWMITKGAPEGVLPLCVSLSSGGETRPMDAGNMAASQATYQKLSAEGYRVLAVAMRTVAAQPEYRAADERDLTLAGYLAFIDPPLENAAQVIDELRQDGVTVKILTGDSELVAQHVCRQVGLDPGRIVLGEEVERTSDAALPQVAEQTNVFARVSPAQKDRIILALKRRSHVVGYMGDGINDSPSLHAADVGISVANAVDVAKDAADIILMERNLRVLHHGILEGRKAFGNVIKYLLMGTSSNFGNMFSMAGASLVLPFLPMLPTQILLNNFLYDLAQVTIPTDNVDPSYVHKPRRWDIRLIRNFMLVIGPLSSIYDFLTFFVLLNVFQASEKLFHTGWFVESLATQLLVVFVIRTAGNPFTSRPSRPLIVTVLAIVLVGMVLPFTPLAAPLGFLPLPPSYFVFLAAATATYLALVQIVKSWLLGRAMA